MMMRMLKAQVERLRKDQSGCRRQMCLRRLLLVLGQPQQPLAYLPLSCSGRGAVPSHVLH